MTRSSLYERLCIRVFRVVFVAAIAVSIAAHPLRRAYRWLVFSVRSGILQCRATCRHARWAWNATRSATTLAEAQGSARRPDGMLFVTDDEIRQLYALPGFRSARPAGRGHEALPVLPHPFSPHWPNPWLN